MKYAYDIIKKPVSYTHLLLIGTIWALTALVL